MDVSTRQLPLEQQVSRAVELFLRMRWLPPVVIALGGLFLVYGLGLQLNLAALLSIALLILLVNIVLTLFYRSWQIRSIRHLLNFAQVQMVLDFIAITALIHFTGGVLSPLIWFYAIHLLIGCIFFKRWQVTLNASGIWLALALMLGGEYTGLIPRCCIFPGTLEHFQSSPGYLVTVLGSNGIGWGVLIWLVTLITERVRAAEREDRELQEKLAKALADLQESEKERVLLRRTMTHEMRSPITATQSMLRLLTGGHVGPLNKQQANMVKKSLVRLNQMMNMLQDLLDLERGKTADRVLETFRLKPLLAELITVYYPQIEEAEMSLEVKVTESDTAYGNAEDIKSILSNLISNAVKYNREGGEVRVIVNPQDDQVEITIADTGIGIPADAQQKLFNEFYRAPNAKTHNPFGTGLGLAIVKGLVQRNGGEIRLESQENVGTTFYVTLPRHNG